MSADGTKTPIAPPRLATRGLVPAIQESLTARIERLLRRPILARVVSVEPTPPAPEEEEDELPDLFRTIAEAAAKAAPLPPFGRPRSPWREDPRTGAVQVRIAIDYDDLWRGAEKEILEAVVGTVENHVTFLTDAQHELLRKSPREFLDLHPKAGSAELLTFRTERVGNSERVVELTIAAAPESPDLVRHIAIVPNLVPLERQLAGVHAVEHADDESPLAPLRALLGLLDGAALRAPGHAGPPLKLDGLDEFQAECVRKALETPHFAVIQGPPGSGKTTVISTILRLALEQGLRVLVVSPTHVAVDNVVEKLAPKPDAPDSLERRSLPVRYSAKWGKLSKVAHAYWIGPKEQRRGATLGERVERRLRGAVPFAEELFARMDDSRPGNAPISAAVASVASVLCGTPIGLLSYGPVGNSDPAAFDLLIVDEVSKMTLPEFVAVAVKARRWVLVGDPEQLPPYNCAEENAETLDALIPPVVELACSVAALLEKSPDHQREQRRLVVVASEPDKAADCLCDHLDALGLESAPVATHADGEDAGILVCTPSELDQAVERLSPTRGHDRTHAPDQPGSVRILVERGLSVPRPAFASGARFVEARERAQVRLFETAFNVYHAQPWSVRTGQRLRLVDSRHGLEACLPSEAALGYGTGEATARPETIERIAGRFALNAVSVYDWLTGVPTGDFDTSPLREIAPVVAPLEGLRVAVAPYVGTLKKQYRMHGTLSRVPREHFYFGAALHDGKAQVGGRSRVGLVQVSADGEEGESNGREAEAIRELLVKLDAAGAAKEKKPEILIITPYKAQERRLAEMIRQGELAGDFQNLRAEVCTLDRCQGREAEYVFISLVRNRASAFMDAPKRWNVALTRAMEGLFLFGDIEAFLREAAAARRGGRHGEARAMSLLARILDAYQRQNTSTTRSTP